jgi:hypothetical protein
MRDKLRFQTKGTPALMGWAMLSAIVAPAGAQGYQQPLPLSVHECETIPGRTIAMVMGRAVRAGSSNVCSTWKWNGRQYEGRWENGGIGAVGVQRYDGGGVAFNRTDNSGATPGLYGLYVGRMGSPGAMSGTFTFSGRGARVQGTWTATFSTAPADMTATPSVSGARTPAAPPQSIGAGCEGNPTGDQAQERGRAAALRHDNLNAARCFLVAARQGKVMSQEALGQAFEKGLGFEVNSGEALIWYRKAATPNNGWAQAQIARLSRNPSESAEFAARAEATDAKQLRVCTAPATRTALGNLEKQRTNDPSVLALRMLACGMGMCPSFGNPVLLRIGAARTAFDFGDFKLMPALDNDEILCESTFAFPDAKVNVSSEADVSAWIAGAAGNALAPFQLDPAPFLLKPQGGDEYSISIKDWGKYSLTVTVP